MAKKKKAADLISLSELAKRAGVSRAAVTMWIKQQEAQGVVIAVPLGRRGKVVDANDKLVTRYINNTAGKSVRPGESVSPVNRSDNFLRKLEYQTKKIQIQNTLLQEKYISRNAAIAFLDELAEIEKRLFSDWAGRVLDCIEAEGKIPMPPEKFVKAKVLIDEALQRAMDTNRRLIGKFKKDTAPKVTARKRA